MVNGVVHPGTNKTMTKYAKIIEVPELREVWLEAMCKELGRLAQGWGNTKDTDTIQFLAHEEIADIPSVWYSPLPGRLAFTGEETLDLDAIFLSILYP